ncbi:MAG TPA: hypothetical protein VH105_25700 [Burkholderiales bacterium]|nr:hypothetical protein [Burkholderiales bacterium]
MRYSRISAPLACSAMLHLAVLQFGWTMYASGSQLAAPWRNPVVLRARLASIDQAPVPPRVSAPDTPPQAPQSAPARTTARRQPRVLVPSLPVIVPEPQPDPVPAVPEPVPLASPDPQPAPLADDSAFLDAGGVDEPARALREPDFYLPGGAKLVGGWQVQFDLLIDAQGKVVRVENVSDGAPRDVIGAVLAAFYVTPFEPAKLAGQPVAIRQRFEVRP